MEKAITFVDASFGARAAFAAAFAKAAGRDAVAATTSAEARVPAEVGAVLAEVGLAAPEVVLASTIASGERVDVEGWGSALYAGEGDLERRSAARIARDKIERRVEALFATR